MSNLVIEKTSNTPKAFFDEATGTMYIEGRSIPENPGEFYKNLINWALEYYKNNPPLTIYEIKLEYINSGSSKSLLELLRIIKEQHDKGNKCIIKWYFEDDDESIQELGEHYQYTLKVPFEFISY